ncbi:hypothetical protein NLZ23_31410, partial [Pseudomonas aeruginosa]|nr:hypothetical protein [Pseudomonas aeruginosa]
MTVVRRIRAAALPDLPDASWSNALLVGEELVMSGMTAHPATRQGMDEGRQSVVVSHLLPRFQASSQFA